MVSPTDSMHSPAVGKHSNSVPFQVHTGRTLLIPVHAFVFSMGNCKARRLADAMGTVSKPRFLIKS